MRLMERDVVDCLAWVVVSSWCLNQAFSLSLSGV